MAKIKRGTTAEKRMGARAAEVPKALRGRTTAATTPVVIRNLMPDDDTLRREWVQERLAVALGKVAWRIDRVNVHVRDESGPTGRKTARATITLQAARHEPIVVTARAGTSQQATATAIRAAERALRRRTERAR